MLIPLIENTFGVAERLESNLVYRSPKMRRIVPTLLAENSSTVDGTLFAFADSASPTGNTLLLMEVTCSHATAAEVPNSIDAYGLTWTEVTNSTVTYNGGAKRVTWFYAWGAAPTAGTVTIGFATSHSSCTYSVISCSGGKLAAPRQATTNTGNSTTVTGTLGALGYPSNMSIYAVSHNANEVHAPPAAGGWVELCDRGIGTPSNATAVGYTTSGDLTADPTWATSVVCAISILEIEVA